jgi:hypothetical protein
VGLGAGGVDHRGIILTAHYDKQRKHERATKRFKSTSAVRPPFAIYLKPSDPSCQTYLFPRIDVGRRLDFPHTPSSDRLAQLPIPDLSRVLYSDVRVAPRPRSRLSTGTSIDVRIDLFRPYPIDRVVIIRLSSIRFGMPRSVTLWRRWSWRCGGEVRRRTYSVRVRFERVGSLNRSSWSRIHGMRWSV